MQFRVYAILLISLFIISCKKDPLPDLPDGNAPYYSIRGLVNNDSINWIVGLDGVTLQHGSSSMNGVQTFYGQMNATAQNMAVRIEILRPELVNDGSNYGAITSNNLAYLYHQPGFVKLKFGFNYSQINYVLVKNQFDEYVAMDQIPFEEFGIHHVKLKFTDYGPDIFTLPVKYGFENQKLSAKFFSSGNADTLIVWPETYPGSHKWYVNDILVSESEQFSIKLNDGIYYIKHKYLDELGNDAEFCTLIRMKDSAYYWQMGYVYPSFTPQVSCYGTVMVAFMKDNVWYKSTKAVTNLSKPFQVSNIETTVNSNLEPLWTMFDFSFGATLYKENQTDSLYLPQMLGAISVGLK